MAMILRQELGIRLRRGCDISGHLEFLYETVRERGSPLSGKDRGRHCQVAELGVRSGNSTAAFLAALEITRGHLWSVDIRLVQVPAEWNRLATWSFLQASDLSEEAKAFIPPQLDVLFIDTNHEQAHTLAELETYGPRVRGGGIICCHDTQWDPSGRQLPEPTGPVALALSQYCEKTGLAWKNRPGSFGMGVIRL
jgi:Methyltransferase domain